jgi:hypothetical protein
MIHAETRSGIIALSQKRVLNTPHALRRPQDGERDTRAETSAVVPRVARPSGMHQYEVLQTLGVGKHGEVKKAIHRLSGCPVSVMID